MYNPNQYGMTNGPVYAQPPINNNDRLTKIILLVLRVIFSIFAIIGVIMLIAGFAVQTDENNKQSTYTPVTGKVVGYAPQTDSDGEVTNYLVASYQVDGQTYTKTSNVYSSDQPRLGEDIELKYNPNDPTDIIWADFSIALILYIIGGIFTVIGIFGLITSFAVRKVIVKK